MHIHFTPSPLACCLPSPLSCVLYAFCFVLHCLLARSSLVVYLFSSFSMASLFSFLLFCTLLFCTLLFCTDILVYPRLAFIPIFYTKSQLLLCMQWHKYFTYNSIQKSYTPSLHSTIIVILRQLKYPCF